MNREEHSAGRPGRRLPRRAYVAALLTVVTGSAWIGFCESRSAVSRALYLFGRVYARSKLESLVAQAGDDFTRHAPAGTKLGADHVYEFPQSTEPTPRLEDFESGCTGLKDSRSISYVGVNWERDDAWRRLKFVPNRERGSFSFRFRRLPVPIQCFEVDAIGDSDCSGNLDVFSMGGCVSDGRFGVIEYADAGGVVSDLRYAGARLSEAGDAGLASLEPIVITLLDPETREVIGVVSR